MLASGFTLPRTTTLIILVRGRATYRQAFLEMLDYYLDQADQTQGNPPISRAAGLRRQLSGVDLPEERTVAQFERLIGASGTGISACR